LSPAAEPSAIPIHGEAKSPEDQHSFQNGAALHSAESAAPSKIGPEAEPVEPETSETAADKTQRSASESSPEASSVASGEETRRPSISKVVSHPRPMRRLLINFRRTGNLERDKYRLRELYETVREPKGRDAFVIRLLDNGRIVELSFPNDGCTITEKLKTELQKHFRVDYEIEELAEP
jgi:hypothetical protein